MDGKEESNAQSCRYYLRIMMNINKKLVEEFIWKKSQILAVTKYFESDITDSYIEKFQKYRNTIFWFWENRIAQIIEKNIPRNDVHFIWNIQSKEIKKIVEHCSYIHSIWNIKHFLKIFEQASLQKKNTKIFLQVRLDSEKNIWFSEEEIAYLLSKKSENTFLEIIGISGMWAGEFTETEKIAEFQYLIDMRDSYMPDGKISAGTSRDYNIALNMNIDIVRIWKKLFL